MEKETVAVLVEAALEKLIPTLANAIGESVQTAIVNAVNDGEQHQSVAYSLSLIAEAMQAKNF